MEAQQPRVAYLKHFDSVANPDDQLLTGAVNVVLENLTELKKTKANIFMVCPVSSGKLDNRIRNFFRSDAV